MGKSQRLQRACNYHKINYDAHALHEGPCDNDVALMIRLIRGPWLAEQRRKAINDTDWIRWTAGCSVTRTVISLTAKHHMLKQSQTGVWTSHEVAFSTL